MAYPVLRKTRTRSSLQVVKSTPSRSPAEIQREYAESRKKVREQILAVFKRVRRCDTRKLPTMMFPGIKGIERRNLMQFAFDRELRQMVSEKVISRNGNTWIINSRVWDAQRKE